VIVLMIRSMWSCDRSPAQFVERRHHRGDRLSAALRHPDPAPYFDTIPADLRTRPASTAARASRLRQDRPALATPALAACSVIIFIISWPRAFDPADPDARPNFMTCGRDREPGGVHASQSDDGDLPACPAPT